MACVPLPSFRIFVRILLGLLLGGAASAQRPRSADEALARYEQVRDRPEAERRRAVGDLGDFADDKVTAVLVTELERAQELGYRQAVVRALGQQSRAGAVPALQAAFAAAGNSRLADSVAEGLARQGDAGVAALVSLLTQERSGSSKWNSACGGLGRAGTAAARDALLGLLQRVGGRERLPPLRSLRAWTDDPPVVAARLQLARDQDPLVAATALQQLAEHGHEQSATLALELHRRLPPTASAEQHAAVVHGLLRDPTGQLDALLASAALADEPFAESLQPLWRQALTDAALVEDLATGLAARRSVAERCVGARALQFADPSQAAAAAATLVALLAQRDAEVVRAAAGSLRALAPDRAAAALAPLLANAADPVPAIALEALTSLRREDPAWTAELLAAAGGRTPGLRAAALQLLAGRSVGDPAAALAAAQAGLVHKAWPVRAAAIQLVVSLREAAGIPLLFERLDAEQARLRADLVAALRELTGLQFPTTAAWRQWWAQAGATFEVPPPAPARRDRRRADAGTTASYWDLPVQSDRVVFVVDVSGSMNQPFGTGNATRLDEAKRQLDRVLAALPPKAKANIVAFGTDAQVFAANLQTLDERRRKAASGWVAALEARGATNVHAALQRAFADQEADTIFLLTDGRPSAGAIVAPAALADEVRRWNVGRGLRIHTVALGGRSELLERLAADSGGEHTVAP
jgi:hypothetical protein